MKHAFGIDLGTTNSCIAVKTVDHPAKIIPLADGSHTLPSCVMYKDGKVIVGREAYKNRFDTDHVVYSSKRDIGSDKVYRVYANGDDQPPIDVTPVDVACEILKTLKHDAELVYGEGYVTDVTITVPAYFTGDRRAATIKAAEQAGLHVLALINEPTSAAIAYTEGKSGNENILVYDLGGGTFDVTLLSMIEPDVSLAELFGTEITEEPMARVLSSAGDPLLGGDDFDRGVFELAIKNLSDSISEELGQKIDVQEYLAADEIERIILTIEGIKKSGKIRGFTWPVIVNIPGHSMSKVLTVEDVYFHQAFEPIYTRTMQMVKECMKGQDLAAVDKLILIGGSTRLQLLRDKIVKDFNMHVYLELNPDEAVALGAAVYTSILAGSTRMKVSDVLPQSIGFEATLITSTKQVQGRFSKSIPKNTPLPASAEVELVTLKAGETRAVLPIYQGENPIAENNLHIGTVVLELPPSEEIQRVKATLAVNASGVLSVALSSGAKHIKVELQNILRPANVNVSKRDMFAKRLSVELQKYELSDPEGYARGVQAVQDFKDGKIPYGEAQKLIKSLDEDSISAADEDATVKKSYSGLTEEDALTHLFSGEILNNIISEEDDENSDDVDDED